MGVILCKKDTQIDVFLYNGCAVVSYCFFFLHRVKLIVDILPYQGGTFTMHRILELIENNADLSAKDIATMLAADVKEVEAALEQYKAEGVIVGKRTVINWQKTSREYVTAMIELKVTPQYGKGFDEIAERCYQYDQVKNVFLMSGGYDLALTVEGKTLTDVALFVSEKLAPMDQVLSTATHFVLRKYKEDGVLLTGDKQDERRVMMF